MSFKSFLRGLWAGLLCAVLLSLPLKARADGDDAARLRANYGELREVLRDNDFQRPLHIASSESDDRLRGQVHAVLAHPFARVRDTLRTPARWCDIMILPFNTKYCHVVTDDAGQPSLRVRIGRKFDQPVEKAYRLDFAFRNVTAGADFFESRVAAAQGPLGTYDYRISVSAIPLDAGHTFLKLDYSYGFGAGSRMAMQVYLATVGADKVGFTTVRGGNGNAELIGGMRGAVERNAMRYYLAIDAVMDSLVLPPSEQVERRIQAWFDATERYPRQLREMDRGTYVAMKRLETERQQALID
jgi:hypothetical protein